jgi:hypothetical protein
MVSMLQSQILQDGVEDASFISKSDENLAPCASHTVQQEVRLGIQRDLENSVSAFRNKWGEGQEATCV